MFPHYIKIKHDENWLFGGLYIPPFPTPGRCRLLTALLTRLVLLQGILPRARPECSRQMQRCEVGHGVEGGPGLRRCLGYLLMWVKQCHKPAMTGNGKHATCKNGDLQDGLLLFYPHYYFMYYQYVK